jgi:AcrR family transcriptional regulator
MDSMLDDAALPLRQRKKAATRERLYREALALFGLKGFAAATVDEIAQAAGVSRGTFFNYFPTKEDLLHYLGERQARAVGAEIEAALRNPRLPAAEKLARLLTRLTETLEAEAELTRVAVFEFIKVPHVLAADPYRRQFRAAVAGLLAEGQARGEVRPDADPDLAAAAVTGVYFQQVFEWCLADPPYSLAGRVAAVVDVLWRGLEAGDEP